MTINDELGVACERYLDALMSGNRQALMAMIDFPETQFFADGEVRTLDGPGDYPEELLRYGATLRILRTKTLDRTDDLAVVKVTFERSAAGDPTVNVVAWWCFRLVDGEWRMVWRQVVGLT